jgi:hypothetical protein
MSDAKSRLLRDIDRLLGYILLDMGHPARHLSKISGKSPNTVYHWSLLEFRPDADFSPKFIEKAGEAAVRIRRGQSDFRSESKALFGYAKKYEPVGRELYVDPEKVRLQQRLMYALGMAELYAASRNGGADIYQFKDRLEGKYTEYEGRFFMLPPGVLSKEMQMSGSVARPFYALTYIQEKCKMVFLDEEGRETNQIPLLIRKKQYHRSGQAVTLPKRYNGSFAPAVPCISGKEEVSDICIDFFRRHNYDISKNLRAQIIEDAVQCRHNIASYCSANLAHTPHRVSNSNNGSAGAY